MVSMLSTAFVTTARAQYLVDPHTVALWHFDEGSGTTLHDETGVNDGTIYGNPTWVDGKFGKALQLDGVDDYIRVPDDPSIEVSSITVEAWVKRLGSPGSYKYIISKYYAARPELWSSFAFTTGWGGGLFFYIGYTDYLARSPNAGTGIWDGDWHHIVGTFDGSDVRLYVDGVQVGTGTPTTESIAYDTGDLFIGNYRPEWGLFSGTIDEVRIRNIARAPANMDKTLSVSEGELGDVVRVTLTVTVPSDETATVVDTLPLELNYIRGTFMVNGVPATPAVKKTPGPRPRNQLLSYTITAPGTYMIEFDVKVVEACWEDREVCNVVVGTWYDGAGYITDEREATACFIIHAFEELNKRALETLTITEKTDFQWTIVTDVTNSFPYTMTNAVLTDTFGSEIEIDPPFPYNITHGTVSYTTKGKSEKVLLTWEIGDILPGETASLIFLVSTDKFKGKQQYGEEGIYLLSSGAALRFVDPEQDTQLSAVSDPIYVTVLPL